MEGEGSDGGTDGGEESGVLASHFVRGQLFLLVSGCLRLWVVVLIGGRWSSCVGRASCPGCSSFVRGGHRRPRCHLWSRLVSLGLGCRLWAPGRRSWVVGPVRRWCTLFMAGGLMCGVVVVCRVVAALHRLYGCHVALLATWPLYLGVRKDGGGRWVLT